jgi:hypothetical protein
MVERPTLGWTLLTSKHVAPIAVAAGIVSDPFEHAASGHRELLGLRQPVLCDVDASLRCFDGDRSVARRFYQERLRAVAEERWFRAGVRDLPWWSRVDDDDETVALDAAPADAFDFEGQPLVAPARSRPPLAVALEVAEGAMGLPRGHLAGAGRSRYLSWHRCAFATFAVSWLGYRVKDVAMALDKAPGTVSRWLAIRCQV